MTGGALDLLLRMCLVVAKQKQGVMMDEVDTETEKGQARLPGANVKETAGGQEDLPENKTVDMNAEDEAGEVEKERHSYYF